MSKAKRWKKSIARARRKTFYKGLLKTGWTLKFREPNVTYLAPPAGTPSDPIIISGIPRANLRKSFTYDIPKRSFANVQRKTAKGLGMTFRQYMSGNWPDDYDKEHFVRG